MKEGNNNAMSDLWHKNTRVDLPTLSEEVHIMIEWNMEETLANVPLVDLLSWTRFRLVEDCWIGHALCADVWGGIVLSPENDCDG